MSQLFSFFSIVISQGQVPAVPALVVLLLDILTILQTNVDWKDSFM